MLDFTSYHFFLPKSSVPWLSSALYLPHPYTECPGNILEEEGGKHTSSRMPCSHLSALTSPRLHGRHVLALPRQLGVFWVVALHVSATAAAGGVDGGFDGWGCEVRRAGGIVDGGADVAGAAAAVGGFGVAGWEEGVGHSFLLRWWEEGIGGLALVM